jgi:RNA polymerase sigma-70 factor (ECF subfamily)
MPELDSELMAAAQRGQSKAFGTLVERYAPALLGFVSGLTQQRQRAEEIVQDAFLQVWQTRQKFDVTRPFKPWLYRIALNRWRAVTRHAHDEAPAPLDLEAVNGSPVRSLLEAEQNALVRAAVARLPLTPRTVVMLRIWEEMAYSEIAALLNIPEGTARSHMHHALAILREQLASVRWD